MARPFVNFRRDGPLISLDKLCVISRRYFGSALFEEGLKRIDKIHPTVIVASNKKDR